jgi:RNA polymerase sigma-70 factor (ECF subfamily)
MREYLKQLSEENRTVLVLHYSQQMTLQEIADLLEEPIDTIKSRHRRGLLYLRHLIAQSKNGGAPKS